MMSLIFIALQTLLLLACKPTGDRLNLPTNTIHQQEILSSQSIKVDTNYNNDADILKQDSTPHEAADKDYNELESSKSKIITQKFTQDSIIFEEFVYRFDTIESGDIVKHRFDFINKNDQEIEIDKTVPDCGCTTPSYPFLPIKSHDKAYIGVTFNSVGKSGDQEAKVDVYFKHLDKPITLRMAGYVKENKQK